MSSKASDLDLARAVLAKQRAGGAAGPASKYMPGVPRVAHADGGKVDGGISAAETVAQMLREGRAKEVTNAHLDAADPQHLWKLYESGATGMEMPMDAASRAKRSRAMGLSNTGYRGQRQDATSYTESPQGRNFGTFSGPDGYPVTRAGTFFSGSPKFANDYARELGDWNKPKDVPGATVGKYKVPKAEPLPHPGDVSEHFLRKSIKDPEDAVSDAMFGTMRWVDHGWQQLDDDPGEAMKLYAKDRGHAAHGFDEENASLDDESKMLRSKSRVVYDPKNIRSAFARFDPRLAHLSHLSAATGGVISRSDGGPVTGQDDHWLMEQMKRILAQNGGHQPPLESGIQPLDPDRKAKRDDFLAGNHPEVPDVVYHGTRKDFGTFFPLSHFGTVKAARDRLYGAKLTDEAIFDPKSDLKGFAHDTQIMPVHLSMKRPLDLGYENNGYGDTWQNDRDMLHQVSMALRRHGKQSHANAMEDIVHQARNRPELRDRGPSNVAFYRRAADLLQDAGFDGLMYKNLVEDHGSRSFVPLIPNQIKSAIGNRGSYDPNEHAMTKAEGGEVGGMGDNGGPPLSEPPVDLGLHRFHRKLGADIRSTVAEMGEAVRKAREAGAYDGLDIGTKLQSRNIKGDLLPPVTITHHSVQKWKPTDMNMRLFRERGYNPTLIEHNGVQYIPTASTQQGNPGDEGSSTSGGWYTDHLKRMPKIGKLRSAFAEGGPVDISTPRSMLSPEQNDTFTRMAKHGDIVQRGIAAGLHRGLRVGDEFTSAKGRKIKVTGLHMSDPKRFSFAHFGIEPTLFEGYTPSFHYDTDGGHTSGIGSVDILHHWKQNGETKRTAGPLRAANPEEFATGGTAKFYSKAAEAIRSLPMKQAPEGQFLAALPGRGVKKAELDNVERGLGSLGFGDGKVVSSREDMAKVFDQAIPSVVVKKYEAPRKVTNEDRKRHYSGDMSDEEFEHLQDIAFSDKRQYANYTTNLPGADNYREHLLTLPFENVHKSFRHTHWRDEPNVVAHLRMEDHQTAGDADKTLNDAYEANYAVRNRPDVESLSVRDLLNHPEMQSTQKAINDAILARNNVPKQKYLHVHEAQSDWNTAARKSGMTADRHVSEAEIEAAQRHRDAQPTMPYRGKAWHDADAEVGRLSKMQAAPPTAPYVSPTDSSPWIDLAMKHLLHTAAEGGYDGVSVSTPEEQMSRWRDPEGAGFKQVYGNDIPKSLAKHVQMHDPSITPTKLASGHFAIPLTDKARQSILSRGFPAFQRGGYIEISHD